MIALLRHILLSGFILTAAVCVDASADTSVDSSYTYIVVDSIAIVGNKHTKSFIIERELNFKKGDTILVSRLEETIRKSNNRLFNTTLFLEAEIGFIGNDSIHKTCAVYVKERFFTYVVPIIGLADRNFNEWWVQRNHDLSRIEWGAYFIQKNMRGRNETLKFKVELGFVKKAEVTYTIPYLTRSRKLGLILYSGFMLNKQVAYNTVSNKLSYMEGDGGFIRRRFSTGITFTYRGSFYLTHQLGITYNNHTIADTVAEVNPKYFLHSQTREEFFSLKYSIIKDHRDIMYYPLKGSYLRLDAEQMGFGLTNDINMTSLKSEASIFKPLYKKHVYFAGTLKAKYSTPIQQPYFNQRGLGYDKEVVSGYEQYVIDGQKYLLSKFNVKWKLFEWKARIEGLPEDRFKDVPLRIFLKAYADMGYVWDHSYATGNSRFANKFLSGAGVGLDFVSYYDFVMRVEYSVNRDLESGFFLNFKAGI